MLYSISKSFFKEAQEAFIESESHLKDMRMSKIMAKLSLTFMDEDVATIDKDDLDYVLNSVCSNWRDIITKSVTLTNKYFYFDRSHSFSNDGFGDVVDNSKLFVIGQGKDYIPGGAKGKYYRRALVVNPKYEIEQFEYEGRQVLAFALK